MEPHTLAELHKTIEDSLEVLDMVAVNYRDLPRLGSTEKGLLYEWNYSQLDKLREAYRELVLYIK